MTKTIFLRKLKKMENRRSEMLDEPIFECKACRIVFAVKYLPEFAIKYCPRCAAPVGENTTLRKEYLR